MLTVAGPCGDWDLDETACTDWADFSPAVTGRSATAAVNLLYRLTGRRFGTCDITIRPCSTRDLSGLSSYNSGLAFPPSAAGNVHTGNISPLTFSGDRWYHSWGCDSCSSPDGISFDLPITPAASITEVLVDGVTQDITEFSILNKVTILWRSPDGNLFPPVQDLTKPTSESGTWSVEYTYGTPPPSDASYYLGILACEIAKSQLGLPCALPRRIQTLTRQGVSMTLVEGEDFIENGLVGLTEVDEFIRSVNPYKLRERSRVVTPDTLRQTPAVQTWQGV